MNKIILYIATSRDGFIADINGGVDWLPHPKDEYELKAVGYTDLIDRIDTILMGSKSYKQILGFGEWGWKDKQTYVFTSQPIQSEQSYIKITHDSPINFISHFKETKSLKDIWLLGGAALATSFAKHNLIDEVILTIVPQTLEKGIPLGLDFDEFEFVNEAPLMYGMVQRLYKRKSV